MLYLQKKKLQFSYLLTSRLNQDFLENTFALFRQRGGYNPNPTTHNFDLLLVFSSLGVLAVEAQLAKTIDVDGAIDDFVVRKARRKTLGLF